MFPQKLKDLLEGVGYKCLQGDDQVLVNDVVYDSRRVRPGCVFVCLIGSAVDSHQYAAQAVEAGAAAVVASRQLELENSGHYRNQGENDHCMYDKNHFGKGRNQDWSDRNSWCNHRGYHLSDQ